MTSIHIKQLEVRSKPWPQSLKISSAPIPQERENPPNWSARISESNKSRLHTKSLLSLKLKSMKSLRNNTVRVENRAPCPVSQRESPKSSSVKATNGVPLIISRLHLLSLLELSMPFLMSPSAIYVPKISPLPEHPFLKVSNSLS